MAKDPAHRKIGDRNKELLKPKILPYFFACLIVFNLHYYWICEETLKSLFAYVRVILREDSNMQICSM